MLRVERTRSEDSKGNVVVDLQVSTVEELPALGGQIGLRQFVGAGSVAQVIQTGAFFTLDSNGTWYDENGNAAS